MLKECGWVGYWAGVGEVAEVAGCLSALFSPPLAVQEIAHRRSVGG